MQATLFLFLGLLGMLTFCGVLVFFLFTRLATHQRAKAEVDTSDLHLLQETVETLIARLEAASDEAVCAIDEKQQQLQTLLDRVDDKIVDTAVMKQSLQEVSRMAGEGMDEATIARVTGLQRGEVELMLELQAARN